MTKTQKGYKFGVFYNHTNSLKRNFNGVKVLNSNKKKLAILILISIVVSFSFVQSFSSVLPGNYIIELDSDETISNAISTIKKNVPKTAVVKYGSLKHLLISHRIVNPLIWIGHGNKEGINSQQDLIPWDK
jgi:hypothetical protein